MSWSARFKAAIQGAVDGADVRALLVATTPLSTLRQGLEDRQLEAELAHTGQEWQVAVDLGEIAAPLWLAEQLVMLAGSLVDAEAEANTGRQGLMSAASHNQALLLLQPVGPLIAELSAALVDPARHPSLPLPFAVDWHSSSLGNPLFAFPPAPAYPRGLLRGAERLEGATHLALQNLTALVSRSTPPPWITAALSQFRGELAASGSRVEMIRTRSAMLLNQQALDERAMSQMVADLWQVINGYLRAGQLIAAPRLLPGAPRPPASPVHLPPSTPGYGPAASSLQAPPPAAIPLPQAPPPAERDRTIPAIRPVWQTGTRPPSEPAPAEETARPLPRIGDSNTAPRHTTPNHGAHALPEIAPARYSRSSQSGELPEIAAERQLRTDDPRALPQIEGLARAVPAPHQPDRTLNHVPPGATAGARRIGRTNRWLLSSPAARHRLRVAGLEDQAERDLAAFWEARDWTLAASEQAYLDQVTALAGTGAILPSGRSLGSAPFAPIYRVAGKEITLLGRQLQRGRLFAFDYQPDRQALLTLSAQDGLPD